ncbi:hypothetical protein R70006_05806 [Paraburkholderia domus]|uniref:glycosyltransferase family 2 protein n=1 Tax=Paraburkholderia domus TaxID=2793075 RepID=UPI0019143EBE|nr:glycosyltransferase [Paraburkholderia domus]MBK5052530.1 glycosyltransferase [Burkholderia sp. R-70006]CAE6812114.1 hypothetical protein R70006_05806 [Paraburkholderia domus]CAE6889227.1 hypothetical protein R75471_02277 [Paraburkholderia domus]
MSVSPVPPKLSVVVSCYNQEAYVAECIDSILSQELDTSFEIVISDDCSTDRTPTILADIAARYPNQIRLLENTENVGAARNYFRVHNAATGEYVAHIDGDDIMLPGKLQAQVATLDSHPDCMLVFHRARYFNDERTYVDETGVLPPGTPEVCFSIRELARWGTVAVHSSYMYRRSSRKTRVYTHDVMEWYFSMEHLDAPGSTARFLNKVLVEYRCNESGQAYSSSRRGRNRAYTILIGHLMDRFSTNKELRRDIYAHALFNILTYHRNARTLSPSMIWFLIRNVAELDLSRLRETISIRRVVGPSKRIR